MSIAKAIMAKRKMKGYYMGGGPMDAGAEASEGSSSGSSSNKEISSGLSSAGSEMGKSQKSEDGSSSSIVGRVSAALAHIAGEMSKGGMVAGIMKKRMAHGGDVAVEEFDDQGMDMEPGEELDAPSDGDELKKTRLSRVMDSIRARHMSK